MTPSGHTLPRPPGDGRSRVDRELADALVSLACCTCWFLVVASIYLLAWMTHR